MIIAALTVATTLSFAGDPVPFQMPAIPVAAIPSRDFRITDYGAKPGGSNAAVAFSEAFASAERAGGGRVVVPKGEWVAGAIRFRSNCALHFEDGAKLVFTDDPADYPEVFTTWEGIECYNHSPLIYAFGCTNVAITGTGLIEPRMKRWSEEWAGYDAKQMAATRELYLWGATNAPMNVRRLMALDGARARPHLIQFNRCANVLLDGFRVNGSPFWLIHLYHSENCIVRNLSTYARGLNNDGLDIDMTRNVLVENCRFDQGDDGIVLKAGRNADAWRLGRPTENIVVRNCDLASSHSLLGIGSELSGGIRNVWVTDCKVETAFNLLKIKTGRRRGGFVRDVWVENCTADDVGSVFSLTTVYAAQYAKFPDFEIRYTDISGIRLKNISCNRARLGVDLKGEVNHPARGIEIANVRIGEVTEGLSRVENCEEVRIDGLALGTPDRVRRWIREAELDKADAIARLSPSYAKAIAFLRRPDLRELPLGRYPIDGEKVVAEILEVTTSRFSPTDKRAVRDQERDLLYFIVDGEEEMMEIGESFAFHWMWRPLVVVIPAGTVHSPHHTNKGPKRLRVCVIGIKA
ncbi:MAG: glycosyl hydrolase family 28 protein [Verrucomicrobiota bacterium]|nr:glycosyl hydrolase family 28 protein [Verrucomicrobiota bacterium]